MDNYSEVLQGQRMEISDALLGRKENPETGRDSSTGCNGVAENADTLCRQSQTRTSRTQQEAVHSGYEECNNSEVSCSDDASHSSCSGSCSSEDGLSITESLPNSLEQLLPSSSSYSLNSSLKSGHSVDHVTTRSASTPELLSAGVEPTEVHVCVPVRSVPCSYSDISRTQLSAIVTSPILPSHPDSVFSLSSRPTDVGASPLCSHSIAVSSDSDQFDTQLFNVRETDCAANGHNRDIGGADPRLLLNNDVHKGLTCIPLTDHKTHLEMNDQCAANNFINSPEYLEYCTNKGPKHMTCVSMTSFSSLSSDSPMCRICHEGDLSGEDLLAPCRCAGTLSYQHRKCLEQWLQTTGTDVCELCDYHFTTKRKARPFSEWICQPARLRDRRNILTDCGCFSLLTPLVCVSTWLCLNGAHHYLNYYKGRGLEGMGLIALASVLILIYLFWTLMSLRYHCTIWRTWRKEHQRVHVVMTTTEQQQQVEPGSNSKLLPNRTDASPKSAAGSCSLHSISLPQSPIRATSV